MTNSVITFPTPPYSNPPIEPQFYQPRVYTISAIALGLQTIVTTSIDHDYVIGQWVRLLIPSNYGTRLLNEKQGMVVLIPQADQVVLDIDSNSADAFIANPTYLAFQNKIYPQIVPIGDQNSGAINANGRSPTSTIVPGSFINISPQ